MALSGQGASPVSSKNCLLPTITLVLFAATGRNMRHRLTFGQSPGRIFTRRGPSLPRRLRFFFPFKEKFLVISYGTPEFQFTSVIHKDCPSVCIEIQSLVVVSPFGYFYLFRNVPGMALMKPPTFLYLATVGTIITMVGISKTRAMPVAAGINFRLKAAMPNIKLPNNSATWADLTGQTNEPAGSIS